LAGPHQRRQGRCITTLLGTTEGTIKNRRQRIRRWLSALAEQNGVADRVEAGDKSGENQKRATRIQAAYRNGRKPKVSLAVRSNVSREKNAIPV